VLQNANVLILLHFQEGRHREADSGTLNIEHKISNRSLSKERFFGLEANDPSLHLRL